MFVIHNLSRTRNDLRGVLLHEDLVNEVISGQDDACGAGEGGGPLEPEIVLSL